MHYNFPYTRDKQSALAELIVGASPAIDQVVFFNSGSDATAMALRAARAHTGKPKLGIFDGAYHGTQDFFQVAAAPGNTDRERPEMAFTSDGVPECVAGGVSLLPYNTPAAFDRIREQAGELAMVMVQAVQASNPRLGMGPWLRELAEVCQECDVLLAFDETVTGFRMAWGGGHVYYDVKPDLVTYGKVIGGGMPIGCVGGRAAIMRRFGTALNGLFPLADGAASGSDEPISAGGMAEGSGVFGAIGTFNGFPLALVSTDSPRIDRRLASGRGEKRRQEAGGNQVTCAGLRRENSFRSGQKHAAHKTPAHDREQDSKRLLGAAGVGRGDAVDPKGAEGDGIPVAGGDQPPDRGVDQQLLRD